MDGRIGGDMDRENLRGFENIQKKKTYIRPLKETKHNQLENKRMIIHLSSVNLYLFHILF